MIEWFAVHTHARAEAKALLNLRRQGFDAYLPLYLKSRSHARRLDKVPAPLFPRYLFVGVDLAVRGWRSIRSTFGVANIVCVGDRPAPVPSDVIADIRAREDSRGFVSLAQVANYHKGQRVDVVEGVLFGARALFDCHCDDRRAHLLIDLLGRQVRVTLPLTTMAPAA